MAKLKAVAHGGEKRRSKGRSGASSKEALRAKGQLEVKTNENAADSAAAAAMEGIIVAPASHVKSFSDRGVGMERCRRCRDRLYPLTDWADVYVIERKHHRERKGPDGAKPVQEARQSPDGPHWTIGGPTEEADTCRLGRFIRSHRC